MNKFLIGFSFVFVIFSLGLVASQETVNVLDATVCCEETNSGLFCQDVPAEECKAGVTSSPTACESTAFCQTGYCFDSTEGTCFDNVAQSVCQDEGGTWSATKPEQCNLGCCVLGDQASFVTLTRCRRLSGFFGLETNYNSDITDETQCILSARADERGACVYTEDFEKTCRLTTRTECTPERFQAGGTPSDAGSGGNDRVTPNTSGDSDEDADEEGSSGFEDSGLTPAPNSGGNDEETEEPVEEPTDGGVTGQVIGTVTAQEGSEEEESLEISGDVEFFAGKLCSAEELGTNCAPTENTICVDGKEEVYFVDTCGNPANIYDAGKVNDGDYWANILDKSEACSPDSNNENSQSCGNCNYLLGSFCRESKSGDANPTYGDYICKSLNCVDESGAERLHGESWCGYDEDVNFEYVPVEQAQSDMQQILQGALGRLNSGGDVGAQFLGSAGGSVGSRYYRYVCNNGQVITEPCADFRQEECIENVRQTTAGDFVEAACRVNRWQDCTAQINAQDCANTDRRDCTWLEGIEYILMGAALGIDGAGGNGSQSLDGGSLGGIQQRAQQAIQEAGGVQNIPMGACVPKSPPGLNFWSGEEALGICGQANAICPVTYEKGILEDEWECIEHCECLTQDVELKRAQVCMAIGDCGPKVNYVGVKGVGKGYKVTEQEIDSD